MGLGTTGIFFCLELDGEPQVRQVWLICKTIMKAFQVDDDAKARVDRWLWAVRVFKSRSLATDACKAGKVRLGGNAIKPSRTVQKGDLLEVRKGAVRHRYKVLGAIEKRVGAKLVEHYMQDQTPQEELDLLKQAMQFPSVFHREGKKGRPTKKDRRDMEDWRDQFDDLS